MKKLHPFLFLGIILVLAGCKNSSSYGEDGVSPCTDGVFTLTYNHFFQLFDADGSDYLVGKDNSDQRISQTQIWSVGFGGTRRELVLGDLERILTDSGYIYRISERERLLFFDFDFSNPNPHFFEAYIQFPEGDVDTIKSRMHTWQDPSVYEGRPQTCKSYRSDLKQHDIYWNQASLICFRINNFAVPTAQSNCLETTWISDAWTFPPEPAAAQTILRLQRHPE